jgi:hypothetical protein
MTQPQLIKTTPPPDHAAKTNDNTTKKSQQHLPQQFRKHSPPHRLTIFISLLDNAAAID